MRTRFIPINFFNSAQSETLETLRFPPPHLPPSDLPNLNDFYNCFDQVSVLNIEFSLQRFQVDKALGKFLSDVLPQNINVEIEGYTGSHVFVRESGFSEQRLQTVDEAERSSVDKIDITFDGKANKNCATLQFEIPELNISLENTCFFSKEKTLDFFELTDTEVTPDMQNPNIDVKHLLKIEESIFLVDDIISAYHTEQNFDILKDGCSIPSTLTTFPLWEVDEISLGISSYISEEIGPLFEIIDPLHYMKHDEVVGNPKDLLLSVKFDLFEHFLDPCPVPCSESELMQGNSGTELDFINFMAHIITDGPSESHRVIDRYSILTWTSSTFEPFQFLDLHKYQFSTVFTEVAIVSEAESCEQMFSSITTLRTFNDLIVSNELTLGDDTFKSLPVPILSDQERIQSNQTLFEEILTVLKPQSSSTSDGIYLDWHLFEEDSCSLSAPKKMLEIDTYSINFDENSYDSGGVVLDFVLADGAPNELNMKDNIEILNLEPIITSSRTSKDPLCHNEGESSELLDNKCQRMIQGEAVCKINAEKVSQVESVSKFSDLDFFLNPLGSANGNPNPLIKRFGSDICFPLVPPKDSIEPCVTTEMQLQHRDFKFHPEGDPQFVSLLNEGSKKLEEQLNSRSVKQKDTIECLEAPDEAKATFVPPPAADMPSDLKSKQIGRHLASVDDHTVTSFSSSPDSIIIVNTQNVDAEMIISRRSTYQRILAMEKEEVQVVERDLLLPVDIIVSAAVCLVWYDCRNIRKKATASDNSHSSVSSCIENIAANVLMSLSFAFTSCILIFEGDDSFLSCVMDSSDGLYAAAASLEIDLQFFCSYSSEMTGDIILNSIAQASELTRGLYPKMPESETLAESFLTKFPSVNPLSAHAILSLVGKLVQFFEWSHQHRLSILQKFLVPDFSISLLNALCRYGEREDSKSGMSDCSSSVSSAPNSDQCGHKIYSEERKRKYTGNPDRIDMPTDYSFEFEKSLQTADDKVWNSFNPLMFKDKEIFDEKYFSSGFNEKLFGINPGADINMTGNPTRLSDSYDFQMSKVPKLSDEIKDPSLPVIDKLFSRSKGVHRHMLKKLDGSSHHDSRSMQEGEVIDIDDDDAVATDDILKEMEKENVTGISTATRNFSSGNHSLPSFPTSVEFSSGLDYWSPTGDGGHGLREGNYQYPHTDLTNKNTPLKHQISFNECPMPNSVTRFCGPILQEKDRSHYSRTPLSNAIHSGQPQQGSPWTIEFLNRIKERSKLLQQSLPCDLISNCYGYSGNSSMANKRKSPSILDFYKYQKGSTPVHIMEPKRPRNSVPRSSSSNAGKTSPPSHRSWTPIDKRAKRRLTFATNGSKGQTKLIWSDNTTQTLNRRM